MSAENNWRNSGSSAANLIPDVYVIEYKPVSGYAKPASQAVQVYPNLPTVISATYTLAGNTAPPQVLLPFPVPVNNLGAYPFGYNGQLQSDVGFGSGAGRWRPMWC
ncbi:MAG: hypothetical protein WDM76_18355 [Limisphaerales bacterium]